MDLYRWLYLLPLRWRSLFRRAEVERELDDELRFHLDHQIEELVARGVAPEEARTMALRSLGGIERRKDECRETRFLHRFEQLLRDVRYAVRTLRGSPGFTAVAVLTLGLGIGANTAIFTVVNAVLLKPLPYDHPDALVVLETRHSTTTAAASFLDWQASAHAFDQLGAAEFWSPTVTGGDRAEELEALHVSAATLPMLGVAPMLGRLFRPDEEHSGQEHVVVLRHDIWKSRFAADPAVIGRTLVLDGEAYTVIGVMPPGFGFAPYWATGARLWAPLVLDRRHGDRNGSSLRIFGRLRKGWNLEQARQDLAAIAAPLEQAYPGTNQGLTAIPLQEKVVGDVRPALLILLAAVGFVLLIACANVAHLQLMRAANREREFALRAALGAARGRLVQQSLVESLMLSLGGAILGLLLAHAGVGLLLALAPAELPRLDGIGMDGRVFAFLLAATLFAGVAFGIAPALASSHVDTHRALKEGTRSGESARRRRIRGGLVVSEFAMALLLLVGAGLVLRSFMALLEVNPGFDPHNILAFRVSLRSPGPADPARRALLFRQIADRVGRLPGVKAVGMINHLPLYGDNWHFPFAVEGRPLPLPGEAPKALFRLVRPGYFEAIRIPIRRGRGFTFDDEAANAHVVLINEQMAETVWPGTDPVGRRLTVDDPLGHPDWFTVIGVVANVRQEQWAGAGAGEMYFPYLTELPGPSAGGVRLVQLLHPVTMTFVVRTAVNPASIAPAVPGIVASLDRDAPVSDMVTMEQAIAEQLAEPRFYMILLGGFAAVALALAALGIYGVLSYSVARRRQEIGIRLALGATEGQTYGLIVRHGMTLALVGTGIGLLGALAITRYLRSLLYGTGATDPVTFALVPLLLVSSAFLACSLPARRAARVDPMVALRSE
jgi:putative ABC transport system permease protein